MPGGYMFGWDDAAGGWVKVQCDANGLLTVDSSLLFENPPTEDETGKGPSSEWAFDHDADVAAHHAKYTDVEARGSIDNIFDAAGDVTREIDAARQGIKQLAYFAFNRTIGDPYTITLSKVGGNPDFLMYCKEIGVGYVDFGVKVYNAVAWVSCIREDTFEAELALYLQNPPIEDEAGKAPTSEWVFDHNANVAAHHAKYTDLEAQEACNLNGNLSWSITGIGFGALNPDTDQVTRSVTGIITANADAITLVASVDLPDKATVTNVIVRGNAGAETETWTLYRFTLTDETLVALATAVVNTADATITSPNIDNSLYAYFFLVYSLEDTDEIHGAAITYTL